MPNYGRELAVRMQRRDVSIVTLFRILMFLTFLFFLFPGQFAHSISTVVLSYKDDKYYSTVTVWWVFHFYISFLKRIHMIYLWTDSYEEHTPVLSNGSSN